MIKTELKYTFFLILVLINFSLLAQEEPYLHKTISVNYNNASIQEIINDLEQKSNISFSYGTKTIKSRKKLTYSANKSVKEILTDISEQLPIKFSYIDNHIIIKRTKRRKNKNKHTISGFLKDNETGENLIGATIIVAETKIGSITNKYGFYSLTLPKGEYIINISYVGFKTQSVNIKLNKNIRLNKKLEFDYEIIADVVVTGNEQEAQLENNQMSSIKLKPTDTENIPEFVGETGLTKTLENIPGIKTYGDGSSFFYVRGGNKDQNMILIDEAPIYNPAHLFGLYSVIIPETTKEINIYKGDIPVNYGDRISSLIDIRTKEGNMNRFGFGGMVNPFLFRLYLETPIVKTKSSAYVSFRRSTIEWLFKKQNPNLNLYFMDLNTKFNLKINDNNRIYYSLYYGKDDFSTINTQGEDYGINWQNIASTIRWNHIFNEKLFSNFIIYGSKYNYNFIYFQKGENIWESSIDNLSVKINLTYYSSPKHTFKFGFNQNLHSINPGNLENKEQIENIPRVSQKQSRQSIFYINSNYKITSKLSYNLGLRLPIWTNTGETRIYHFDKDYFVTDTTHIALGETSEQFVNFNPRVSLRYQINRSSSVKASFGVYHQYLQLITNSTGPFTSLEVWLPSGRNIKPQRADIYALGYIKLLRKYNIELNSELFYKKMYNQIDYKPHAHLLLNPLIEGELRFGKGYSYGAEFMLKKSYSKFSGWISYTYSRVFMKIKDVNKGNEFPAFYDQPHYFSTYIDYKLSKRFTISGNFIYHTGAAITSPIGFYKYNGHTLPIYGDKNNDRLPDYHRLDISVKYTINNKSRRFKHTITLGIYNVYNRYNVVTYSYNKSKNNGQFNVPRNVAENDLFVTTQTSLMGFAPSLTYKFRF